MGQGFFEGLIEAFPNGLSCCTLCRAGIKASLKPLFYQAMRIDHLLSLVLAIGTVLRSHLLPLRLGTAQNRSGFSLQMISRYSHSAMPYLNPP